MEQQQHSLRGRAGLAAVGRVEPAEAQAVLAAPAEPAQVPRAVLEAGALVAPGPVVRAVLQAGQAVPDQERAKAVPVPVGEQALLRLPVATARVNRAARPSERPTSAAVPLIATVRAGRARRANAAPAATRMLASSVGAAEATPGARSEASAAVIAVREALVASAVAAARPGVQSLGSTAASERSSVSQSRDQA